MAGVVRLVAQLRGASEPIWVCGGKQDIRPCWHTFRTEGGQYEVEQKK